MCNFENRMKIDCQKILTLFYVLCVHTTKKKSNLTLNFPNQNFWTGKFSIKNNFFFFFDVGILPKNPKVVSHFDHNQIVAFESNWLHEVISANIAYMYSFEMKKVFVVSGNQE